MEIFIGTDIIEVSRIEKLIRNNRFLNRVFSKEEIEYCEGKANRAENYAARFVAKEAVFKALSSKLSSNYSINWKDISIEKDLNGKPRVVLYNHTDISDYYCFDVSLSHVKEYALAYVIMYLKG